MALVLQGSVSFAAVFPGREVGVFSGVIPRRQRISSALNQRASLPCLSHYNIRFHKSGAHGHEPMRHVVSSFGGDGVWAEELSEAEDDTAYRYPTDFSWESYLGEVGTSEKVEEPPQYVPPPPISAEDICTRDRVEALLYGLERVLPGRLDGEKAQALCSMLSTSVEGQNPVTCFRGSEKCLEWLRALVQVHASIHLHELYYENDLENPEKRRIYTVWTLSFLEHVRGTRSDPIEVLSDSEPNQISGETMFEMEKSGLVSRLSSTWYVLQEDDGGASFTKAKDSLHHLLQRTF